QPGVAVDAEDVTAAQGVQGISEKQGGAPASSAAFQHPRRPQFVHHLGVPPQVGGELLARVTPPRRRPRLDPPPVRDRPGNVRRVHYFAGAFAADFAGAGFGSSAGFGAGMSGASTITSRTSTPSGTLPGSNKSPAACTTVLPSTT